MKSRRFSVFLIVLALMLLPRPGAIPAVLAEEAPAPFEEPVPFALAVCEEGGTIPVYSQPLDSKATGTLTRDQLCAVLSVTARGGISWFCIRYFDAQGEEVTGYAEEKHLRQLTVSGLIAFMADPDFAACVRRFSGLSGSPAFVSRAEADADPGTSAAQTEVTYVLNTSTKRFHLPTCGSASEIKESNRQEFTCSREDLIDMGYRPCGRCQP